jgi:hypothetical protein
MRTPPIIIGGEFRKNPPKVLFVKYYQMIGALAPDRTVNDTETLPLRPFCRGCIIATRGYDFRKGQSN